VYDQFTKEKFLTTGNPYKVTKITRWRTNVYALPVADSVIMSMGGTGYSLPPRPSILQQRDKILDAAVIGFFNVIRKIAGRDFAHASVIEQAIAAYALSAARIGTIAAARVSVFFAVHDPVHWYYWKT